MPDRRSPVLPQPEALFIRKFFDGVDDAVTKELGATEVAYEEFLTPTLGRLLDSRSPFQTILSYPIRELNKDLEECGTGPQLIVEFKTNEHAKGFSGRVSHADLGMVLTIEDPLEGITVKKALLVEAKRLFPFRTSFSVNSRYNSFDRAQFDALATLAASLDWSGIYYFLYNPQMSAFDDVSRKVLRAVESRLGSHWSTNAIHPYDFKEFYYMWRKYGEPFSWPMQSVAADSADPVEARRIENEKTMRRPGLRVLSVSSIKDIQGRSKGRSERTLALLDCYSYAQRSDWTHSSGAVPFPSLSEFLVDFLLSCLRGSTNEKILRVAEGRPLDVSDKPDAPEKERHTLLAKHTLTIRLQSQLPEGAHGIFAREG